MTALDLKKILYATFGSLTDDRLLALTIYGEARGESREGKIAVGSVILERVDHRDWDGRTIKEVCLMPWQFSCFLPQDPNFKPLAFIADDFDLALQKSDSLRACYDIARGLLGGAIPRDAIIAEHHATQYKTIDCKASWAAKMRKVATVNHHEFFA